MGGKRSRDKGKRGEREVAALLRQHGYDGKRGQQYCGAAGDADVLGLPGVHIEVKYVEKLNIHGAIAQSISDARAGETPIVMHRKNQADWLVTMRASDYLRDRRELDGYRLHPARAGECRIPPISERYDGNDGQADEASPEG